MWMKQKNYLLHNCYIQKTLVDFFYICGVTIKELRLQIVSCK